MRADLSKLFVLDEAFATGAIRATSDSSDDDLEKWAVGDCTALLSMRQCAGSRRCDLVGTTHAGLYLLSQRVQFALKEIGATGWRACAVDFKDAREQPIRGYSAIGIVGKSGPLDNSRSRKVTRSLPGTHKAVESWIGVLFEEDTWDGSDFFRPEGTMLTITTACAKDAIEKLSATNIRFRPILEVERAAL